MITHYTPYSPPAARQRGVALFIVLVMVLLGMLLALWASRSALFNQMVIGNDADYQRAFSAAQAMLQDAELDILRQGPNGTACVKSASNPSRCRATNTLYFPQGAEEITPLLAQLNAVSLTKCRHALCTKRGADTNNPGQDFWNNEKLLEGMQKSNVGARYGQYTGAASGSNTDELGSSGSAILNQTGNGNIGAWYWIEVLPYSDTAQSTGLIVGGATDLLPLSVDPLVVYRVTAIAYGRKNGTRVVLQQTFVPQKLKD
ncbi:pilus assembly protein [Allofranklinella schreckenbergeri]|uniref:Pilus assembly protein n=1 Tax=Allofranklinella schreckenbergeri TaxID=1076744 RepID=A0A3M6R9U7_9BURK|nr:pilus assembly protein [Allofranklinella schreckenbergeri]RMX11748.1 pilus assembly protein [Allofranklinella schreckenbergeri]